MVRSNECCEFSSLLTLLQVNNRSRWAIDWKVECLTASNSGFYSYIYILHRFIVRRFIRLIVLTSSSAAETGRCRRLQ
jgi:hypothetical protein